MKKKDVATALFLEGKSESTTTKAPRPLRTSGQKFLKNKITIIVSETFLDEIWSLFSASFASATGNSDSVDNRQMIKHFKHSHCPLEKEEKL